MLRQKLRVNAQKWNGSSAFCLGFGKKVIKPVFISVDMFLIQSKKALHKISLIFYQKFSKNSVVTPSIPGDFQFFSF